MGKRGMGRLLQDPDDFADFLPDLPGFSREEEEVTGVWVGLVCCMIVLLENEVGWNWE